MVTAAPPPAAPAATLHAVVAPVRVAPHGWTTHTVRDGETLDGIAQRYRTSVRVLASHNGIRNPGMIHAGDRLSVPRTSGSPSTGSSRSSGGSSSAVHVVRSGDTMSGIAARYRVSLAGLLKANHRSAGSLIHPGDRIVVRGGKTGSSSSKAASRSSKPASRTYVVRSGDTLGGIAARYDTTVADLARASGISSRSLLQVGQRLRVPTTAAHAVSDTFNGVRYPSGVVAAARRNHDVLARRSVPSRTETKRIIAETARRHGVDPRLAMAVGYHESGWNQRAVSPANAVGVMQVIPSGGDWASSLVGRRLDLLDTRDNITAGVVMLRALGRAASGTDQAIAGYYQGLASVQRHGMYSDTKAYVRSIKRLRATM
ncbi:LysM peptidoglycan-binding domain-containing protein [Phycicoccus sp. MAQZ13P-2]|uniref:LysM peptidoglycan-binding domain-containing protein n=1 Tax=Phycicoccus mangrovi TaxID=2840470 RepID=UPI001C00191D|nr:LysM peptidoglycan-binding domain-containing protein [Phycicoccus mangrovi]MBT9254734.1 LysM peptidoglycan-binding domain-containing protein [Phycicoccus mangrovi]MBT9273061.1 LysM peptidoglycan-binding domain-containing protein [Phycicoccus mangrovi]